MPWSRRRASAVCRAWACGHLRSGQVGVAAKVVGAGKRLSLGGALTCMGVVCLNSAEVSFEQETRDACALETCSRAEGQTLTWEDRKWPPTTRRPILLLLPSPDESLPCPRIDWAVCLLSLIRNWQLQRPEMDSEKQMVFTNNIPKTGFLITPTGPISRHRRQVSLSRGASRRGQVSLPCCGKVFPVPLNRGPQRPQTQASGEGPGVPWADKPSPLRNMDSCGEKVRAESFLLTPDCRPRSNKMGILCAGAKSCIL